jgi:hypothetical protein
VGFDVTGASNSTCNLVVQSTIIGGSAGQAQFFIGSPSPPVQTTTLTSRSPAKTCAGVTGANSVSVSGPPNVTATATRSSTGMCFQTGDLRDTIGYSGANTQCPVTLTLTCEGVIMYDHIPWSICR